MQLPFPLGVVSLYLLEVQQSCTFSSSVILAQAALKWLKWLTYLRLFLCCKKKSDLYLFFVFHFVLVIQSTM